MNINDLKIFVINLDERVDRWEAIQQELETLGIVKYERFSAIKPTEEIKSNPNFLKGKKEAYRIGCYGCLLSHLRIIEKAKKENLKNILILEDDVGFRQPLVFLQDVLTQLQDAVKEFDMFYLSGSHLIRCNPYTHNIVQVKKTLTTSSYVMNEGIYDFVINHLKTYNYEIDKFYAEHVQSRNKSFCSKPHITYQKNGFSDIQQRDVNYKMQGP